MDGRCRDSCTEGGVAGANGLVDAGDFKFFASRMAGPGVTTPPGGVDTDDFAACDFDGDGDVDLADFAAVPRAAGQVDTGSTYTWNAENRLVSVARTYPRLADPNDPPVKVEFRYDYLGRRIEKRVLPWNPALGGGAGGWDATNPTKVTRFVWSGWLMLLELDGLSNCGTPGEPAECVVRKYTWGLDLAGQNGQVNSLESAGAISGLLAAYDANRDLPLWYFYDANGNVGQVLTMIRVDGENYGIIPAAKYEYDPYGNRVNEPASGEYEQLFRFSTRPYDAETGLYIYLRRPYLAEDGRWLNVDPTVSRAVANYYLAFRNNPFVWVDPDGRDDVPAGSIPDDRACSDFCQFSYCLGTSEYTACKLGCMYGSTTTTPACKQNCKDWPTEELRAACEKGCRSNQPNLGSIDQRNCTSRMHITGHGLPKAYPVTDDGEQLNPNYVGKVLCPKLCWGAELVLWTCHTGSDEKTLREIVSRCPKITKVTACKGKLHTGPLSAVWYWWCECGWITLDVNPPRYECGIPVIGIIPE